MESRGGRGGARKGTEGAGRAGLGRGGGPRNAPKRIAQTRPPFAGPGRRERTGACGAATWRTECEHEPGERPAGQGPRGRSGRLGKLRPRGGTSCLGGLTTRGPAS